MVFKKLHNRAFFVLTLVLSLVSCKQQSSNDTVAENMNSVEKNLKVEQTKKDIVLSNKPLAPYQDQLLDVAFEVATAIPLDPHVKDRSKMQELIVEASLELEQPQRALSYTEQIKNWRRGAGYGDLALYCAKNGCGTQVQRLLELADQFSENAEDWRRDQVRVKIARTYAWLGQKEKAEAFESNVVESETAKVAKVDAMNAKENDFEAQVASLDKLIGIGSFDTTKNSLHAYAELFNRFYANAERREFVEEKIKSSWEQLPVFLRIELLLKLSDFSVDNNDNAHALQLIDEAQKMFAEYEWPLEYKIKVMAGLTEARFKAGDKESAKMTADEALTIFNTENEKIVNIYKAGTLRPLAEAYQVMGDTEKALTVYKEAIEKGIENPNSRPRAEDLSSTCLSMALHNVEPDDELWNRIRQIKDGLSDPW
ncbi:MAG: hypothetical protein KC618_01150 [Candidatus Omnitrophica bacterium]|nr:hypothetical protein [Candidatus Omnitrophota bacterium]